MRLLFTLSTLSLLAASGQAQLNDTWAKFELDPNGVQAGFAITDANTEADLDWGDLDGDGAADVVVARSRPNMFQGKRANVLLMSEAGNLVDRTSSFAASSDVAGDQGFLTPTQDRDIELVDVDNDGQLDVVTATDYPGFADPKSISHPRVYHNLGSSGGWLGLMHEDARCVMATGRSSQGRKGADSSGSSTV